MGDYGDAGPNMQNALAEIFAAEGGFEEYRSGSSAYAGITDGALKAAQKSQPELKDVERAKGLSEKQAAKAYRGYFDDALRRYGGAQALESIQDAKTAAAVADTLFMQGANGGARLVKQAVNKTIGELTPEERQRLGVSQLAGKTGPKDTMDTLRRPAKPAKAPLRRARGRRCWAGSTRPSPALGRPPKSNGDRTCITIFFCRLPPCMADEKECGNARSEPVDMTP